jgi:hypothetical protein
MATRAGFAICIENREAEDLPPAGGDRRTSRFSGPALALLAPAAERRRWCRVNEQWHKTGCDQR